MPENHQIGPDSCQDFRQSGDSGIAFLTAFSRVDNPTTGERFQDCRVAFLGLRPGTLGEAVAEGQDYAVRWQSRKLCLAATTCNEQEEDGKQDPRG